MEDTHGQNRRLACRDIFASEDDLHFLCHPDGRENPDRAAVVICPGIGPFMVVEVAHNDYLRIRLNIAAERHREREATQS
jgi:hypothetical protein